MARRKFLLRFRPNIVSEPVTYLLVKDFGLIPNVLRASINDRGGKMVIEVDGKPSEIAAGMSFLETKGVEVQELMECVERDEGRCTHCGMCVSICPVEAFSVDKGTWKVSFDKERCIACGMCINACPPKAMQLM